MDVKTYRTQLNLSQEKLAFVTDIPRSRIAQWEIGNAKPKVDDYQVLKAFFEGNGIEIPEYVKNITIEPSDSIVNPFEILKQARENKKLTAAAMAEKLGISTNKYLEIELESLPALNIKQLKKIDTLLGTHLYKLLHVKNYTTILTPDNLHLQPIDISNVLLPKGVRRMPINHYMQVPYLPAYEQEGYLSAYAEKGNEIDKKLESIIMPKEFEAGIYMVIECTGDRMDENTRKSICDKDQLLIKEIEEAQWKNRKLNYETNFFVLFTANTGIICTQIVKHDVDKKVFTCHALNNLFADFDIHTNEVYRLFYVKKIIDRKIK
ncbi:MAG TPA: helix-turn-helix transcriptional regulator [Chitinophagaceae bacterium]|nr:helix-turn-helix transcriptional regulator [Chitinophagaceae bacterium]